MVAVAGCGSGTKTIDRARVQRFVSNQLTGPRPSSVDCPPGVKARPGTTFECSVSYFDGSTASVTVHVIDKKGDVTVGQSDLHRSG